MPNFNTNNVNDMKNLFFLCPNEIKNKIRDKMAVYNEQNLIILKNVLLILIIFVSLLIICLYYYIRLCDGIIK